MFLRHNYYLADSPQILIGQGQMYDAETGVGESFRGGGAKILVCVIN